MIVRILLFIKHRLPWLWLLVNWVNALLYCLLHRNQIHRQADRAFETFGLESFCFRPLVEADLDELYTLLRRQTERRLEYFQPHKFDRGTLGRMHADPAFLMFGAYSEQGMVGYFFLRCFWNRKCFVGRLIDEPFEGQGIGRVMNQIMYHTAWWSGFRCMTTVSKHNNAIMRSHERNPHARFRQPLPNDYLLIEFSPDVDTDKQL